MAIEKKRPRGLKGSAASNKKTKTQVDPTQHENAQTVVIDKVVEEGDEVGEAAAIFEDAMAKLEKNPTEALALLRGTIHESDRILRAWTLDTPLPLLFYYTYGSALFELGRLAEEEEFEQFMDAAEERLQDGFDHYKDAQDKELVNKMNITLAKIWLTKATMMVEADTEDIPEMALKALETVDKAGEESTIPTMTLLDLANMAHAHGDLYSTLELRKKFTQWAEDIFQRIVKDDPSNARALSQLGTSRLSLANYWLDRMDEMEDQDDQTEQTKEQQHALDATLQAKEYFISAQGVLEKEGRLTPQSYTDLAETYLNEANLTSAPEQQTALYEQVVQCIDQTKSLAGDNSGYTLPEGLEFFLNEWSNNDQE